MSKATMEGQQQLWFLIGESMQNDSFKQVGLTLDEIKSNGISRASILLALGRSGASPDAFNFFIHSESMSASVQMLSDESIPATWQLYCRKDTVITITVRRVEDPSPNSSRAPSHSISLQGRRTMSGSRHVPEIPIQAPVRHVSAGYDISGMESMTNIPEEELVTVTLANGDLRTFTREYLTCWIESQCDDSKPLTEIVAQSFQDGQILDTKLTRDIWERSLVRGPWKGSFMGYWTRYSSARMERESQLASLRLKEPQFTENCKQFICDLRTYRRAAAHGRLDQTGHEFYLGKPYFDSETVDVIMKLRTMGGTVADDLRKLSDKRISAEICASHDLAPIFEAALGISWDKERERVFSVQHEMTVPEVTTHGTLRKIASKSSQFFRKGHQKKDQRPGRGGRGGGGGSLQMSSG